MLRPDVYDRALTYFYVILNVFSSLPGGLMVAHRETTPAGDARPVETPCNRAKVPAEAG